jgi:hypothetical protein
MDLFAKIDLFEKMTNQLSKDTTLEGTEKTKKYIFTHDCKVSMQVRADLLNSLLGQPIVTRKLDKV